MTTQKFNIKARKSETPAPEVKAYHIHIYFDAGKEDDAIEITKQLDERFPDAIRGVHRVGLVGPHAQENIGMTIKGDNFGEIVGWLQMNRKESLSILVHPRTGDEWKDHIECPLWLGKPVPFNMTWFEPLKPDAPKGPGM
jgi:aromatic ring-cleaving dioxygenase